jgi:nicotinamidase-related amidase
MHDSALLVIDVQDSFKARPYWARRGNPDFERNVSALVDAYRAAGRPVIFILHTDDDPEFRRDSPLVRVMDFLTRREDEPLLVKSTRNAFTSTDLHDRLQALGIKRVVITGIQTEQCCETTARFANDCFGYDVDFVTEATQSFPISDGTSELAPEEIMRRTEFVLRGRFARIARVSDIVGAL